MRGVYTATIKIAGLAASKTVLFVTAPPAANMRILSASISNSSNATNQQLEARLLRATAIGSASGTAITPTKEEAGDQASQATVIGNLTTEPAYGTVFLADEGFASLSGWYFQPMPEERPVIFVATWVGLFLPVAPSAMDTEVSMRWVEEG
jgi:hypothetical protein